jgi:hypothetical protein
MKAPFVSHIAMTTPNLLSMAENIIEIAAHLVGWKDAPQNQSREPGAAHQGGY